jgi:hypothetical protein
MGDERSSWDDDFARGLRGKTVLFGLTFASASGEVVEQTQRHGVIEEADPERGVAIRLVAPGQAWHAEIYWVPPDLSSLSEAAPGAYRLRSTGETIVDPDFTWTWEIRSHAAGESTPEQLEARRAQARRLGFPED